MAQHTGTNRGLARAGHARSWRAAAVPLHTQRFHSTVTQTHDDRRAISARRDTSKSDPNTNLMRTTSTQHKRPHMPSHTPTQDSSPTSASAMPTPHRVPRLHSHTSQYIPHRHHKHAAPQCARASDQHPPTRPPPAQERRLPHGAPPRGPAGNGRRLRSLRRHTPHVTLQREQQYMRKHRGAESVLSCVHVHACNPLGSPLRLQLLCIRPQRPRGRRAIRRQLVRSLRAAPQQRLHLSAVVASYSTGSPSVGRALWQLLDRS